MIEATNVIPFPTVLESRWKELKSQMYKLAKSQPKDKLILQLLRERENYTNDPNLSEITHLTGFDVAIHTIYRWSWTPEKSLMSIEEVSSRIGIIGSELMVIHAVRESIRYGLLKFNEESNSIEETEIGIHHFETVNSFNVDITGNRLEVAKKNSMHSRLNKQQRHLDPLYQSLSLRKLYWENSILMLLRTPLTFYRSLNKLSQFSVRLIIEFHGNILLNDKKHRRNGSLKIRLPTKSKVFKALNQLDVSKSTDSRPHFVPHIKLGEDGGKAELEIGLGALTMFVMFLKGFQKEKLDEKSARAEKAVKEVIESTGFWKVIETNKEVFDTEGETVTEIDIIAQSLKDQDTWIHCEVKDFSYWRGWIFGKNIPVRKKYYQQAIEKIPIKENFIREKHQCKRIESLIVTSVPESFTEINGTSIIYVGDLKERLAFLNNRNIGTRKKSSSSNFLIRYFNRLNSDIQQVTEVKAKIRRIDAKLKEERRKMKQISDTILSYEQKLSSLNSDRKTIVLAIKLQTKRLVKDDGSKHFQIENDIKQKRIEKQKFDKRWQSLNNELRALKSKQRVYSSNIDKLTNEIKRKELAVQKLLTPRSI